MLWAVTSYFNPFGCLHRPRNFDMFRRRIHSQGVPLLVVEVIRENGKSEIPDNVAVVRVPGDCMWQKERALNIAFSRLPPNCDKVVMIDSDIIFNSASVWRLTEKALDEVPVVQPFSRVEYLRADGSIDHQWPSVTHDGGCKFEVRVPVAHGGAWAFRRQFIQRHGLHDRLIVGGGDVGFSAAVWGHHEKIPARFFMNTERARFYMNWAVPVACAVERSVRSVDVVCQHLWHGSMKSRGYQARKPILANFNPDTDVYAPADEGLRWTVDDRRIDALRVKVENYFKTRAAASSGV